MEHIDPVVIPVMAMLIPIVAIIAGAYSQAHAKRMRADQTMAMIARGVPLAEIEAFQQRHPDGRERGVKDPMRSLGNARRTAMVLIPLGIGLFVFFIVFGIVALHHIDQTAGWSMIGCSATGLIPLAIGIGFLVDYRMQQRELAQFGLEVGDGKI